MSIKKLAVDIAKRYKTHDPFIIANQKGILIQYESLGGIMGYYSEFKRLKVIHLNHNLAEHELSFVCAHELGHALLHTHVNTPFLKRHTLFSVDKIEREANTFAVELLLSDDVLRENADHSLYNIAGRIGIPTHLITLKLG